MKNSIKQILFYLSLGLIGVSIYLTVKPHDYFLALITIYISYLSREIEARL